MSTGRPSKTEWIVLSAALLAATALRMAWLGERELWYDDLDRVRLSLYSAECLVERLPYMNPVKSPLLMFIHKGWTAITGTDSLFAIRAFGALGGVLSVVLASLLTRRLAGPVAGSVVAWYFAVNPFFVRWSVEVHNYTPAALALLATWWWAVRMREPTVRPMLVLGFLAGLAVALFPPIAPALVPLLLVPAVRRCRAPRAIAACVLAGALTVVPSLLSIFQSWRLHGPAFESGRAWSPYFSIRRTPFELSARMIGWRVSQGGFASWMAVNAGLLAAVAALAGWLPAAGSGKSEDRWRRGAVLAAGVFPFCTLALASRAGIGLFTDRYLHTAAVLLPLAVIAVVATTRVGATRRVAVAITAVLLALPLLTGVPRVVRGGSRFPSASADFRFACNGLMDEALQTRAPPGVILVHGEAIYSQLFVRSRAFRAVTVPKLHLTTDAWITAQRARDTTQVSIPRAYGWVYAIEELAGPGLSVGPEEARRVIREAGGGWVVMEYQRITRQLHLEEQEDEGGLTRTLSRLSAPSDEQRDASIATEVLDYLGMTDGFSGHVLADRYAVIVFISPR